MDKDEMDIENHSYTLQGSTESLLPIQLFEFKAHLLEAVEELRMGRLAKIQYEEQINKTLMEKQELTWKYESLSNQEDVLEKKHNDSLAVLKKQLQAKMCLIEEEKGRFQLAAEMKERENVSLREDVKALQIAKYNFQKKVHEMEQKLQLHILAKEDHIKQLSECKKCIGNVTQQFGMIKEVHEKLEQTVQTAIRNNKKLNMTLGQKKNEIEHLNEELKKLSSDFLNYKVTYKQRADEEDISLSEKEQHVRELKERLQMETEINKKLMEENTSMKEGKQGDMKTLSNMRTLLLRHTQTIISLEKQLSALKEDYKTLERDNELQRAKATENEEKFLALQSEHEKAFTEWKTQKENLDTECDPIKKGLETIKELNLQNCTSEPLNLIPETIIQSGEQQSGYSMDIAVCDIENNTSENRTQNDPTANTTTAYVGSSNDVSLSMTSNKLQEMDGSKGEIVYKDANSLQNVYNITDKGHLSEEQKDESSLTENKVRFSTIEQNIPESCNGKCTEEIPADRTRLKVVDEYEEIAAKCSTIRTRAMAESIMMLPDNNKPPTVCNEDASQQTDSSHCKSKDGTSEEVYIVIDKPDRTDNDKGVLINEMCSKESQLLDQTIEQLVNEQDTTRDISLTGNSPICALGNGSNYHLLVLNRDTSEISTKSCSYDQIQQAELIEPTNEKPGVFADPLFSQQTGRVDPRSVESKGTAKHCMDMRTSFNISVSSIEKAEMKTKCSDQETNFTTSYCSQDSVGNSGLQSLDLRYEDCNVQSLQYTENADVLKVKNVYKDWKEICPQDTGEDTNIEGAIKCDVNVKSKLYSGNHSQTDHTSDPVNVAEEKVCIPEDDNVAAGCKSQVVSSRLFDGKYGTQLMEEKSKHDGKSLINLSNLAKYAYLPGSNLRDSLNISLSNQTNTILSKLSDEDTHCRAKHVPRIDPSAEWNAEQESDYSSSLIPATSSENSDVFKQLNLCPGITNATRSCPANLPNATHTEVTGSHKDNYDISSIQRQISAIERFLFNNKLNGSRKRKLEGEGTLPAEE